MVIFAVGLVFASFIWSKASAIGAETKAVLAGIQKMKIPEEFRSKYGGQESWLGNKLAELRGEKQAGGGTLKFRAQIVLAHPAFISGVPLDVLFKMVDAFKELGVDGVDINPGFEPWLHPELNKEDLNKYDALIEYIKKNDLEVWLAYHCGVDPEAIKDWDWEKYKVELATLKTWVERYHPAGINVVHEITTMESRWRKSVSIEEWARLVEEGCRLIKNLDPGILTGAGGLPYEKEMECLRKYLNVKELDFVRLNIYDQWFHTFNNYETMIKWAKNAGKKVYIGEAWRNAAFPEPGNVFPLFWEPLDIKFLEAVTLYAGTREIEAVCFWWTNLFFKYQDPDQPTKEYFKAVYQAIHDGKRTSVYRALGEIIKAERR